MLMDDRRSRRVAFQGIEGAYSHLASKEFFSDEPDRTIFTGCMTFADVIKAVEDGKASYGVLPIENTTAGSINQVYDLLTRAHVYIVGEEIYSVDHCLLGLKSIPLSLLTRIYSHPQALAQCEHFLLKRRSDSAIVPNNNFMFLFAILPPSDKTVKLKLRICG